MTSDVQYISYNIIRFRLNIDKTKFGYKLDLLKVVTKNIT